MTDLNLLSVSLTKHGAHKIAQLLLKYDKDQVLKHVSGSEPGINIYRSQVIKILSASSDGTVPDLWNEARQQGKETIDALVLIAIIFSHHQLISAMTGSNGKDCRGTITRGDHISEKAYTNLANNIRELGYTTGHSKNHFDYDFQKLFDIPKLNKLVIALLKRKLISAGWDQKAALVEELCALKFHQALSINEAQFRAWLVIGSIGDDLGNPEDFLEDSNFFINVNDGATGSSFTFKPGNKTKHTGTVPVGAAKKPVTANLLHNAIQNSLLAHLTTVYGNDNVCSEHPTGQGTLIDLVVKTKESHWFYEIKTANSVKACIRQAIPQLLEYAYWPGVDDRAEKLIIVSQLPITEEAKTYLKYLNDRFQIPICYEQHQVEAE